MNEDSPASPPGQQGRPGQVFDLTRTPHMRCEPLLPWFVNGTLDARERAEVDDHLAGCERCRTEVRRLRDLSVAVRSLEVDPDCDRAFARLSGSLDATPLGGRPDLHGPWWRRPKVAGAFVAGQMLLLVIAAAWIAWPDAPPSEPYRTLADSAAPGEARFFVTFRDGVSEKQVREAILAVQAHVVDGPTPAGLYVLEVDASAAPQVLAALQANPAAAQVEQVSGK